MWVILSISAAFCWAIVNIIDKYILTKWVRQPFVPVIIYGLIGLVVSPIIYFFHGFSSLSYFHIFLALIAGLFYVLMAIFYFKAVKIEEISRVVPLFYFVPLFILIFAAIFLGEVFNFLQYLGIFLVIAGSTLISLKNLAKIKIHRAFWWMILAALALSLTQIITKYLLNFGDYWTIFTWIRIGGVIGVIPIAYRYLPELVNTAKIHGKRVLVVMSFNESLNLFAVLLLTIAASVGYITLVNTLSSIEPFFVLLFIIILNSFYPSILKEEISKSVIFQKIVAIILMFIGVILIT